MRELHVVDDLQTPRRKVCLPFVKTAEQATLADFRIAAELGYFRAALLLRLPQSLEQHVDEVRSLYDRRVT